ncbi:MAG: toll/interleukin-1 receptor domain-containing protein [Pseudonocardiaceae bacterium]
MLPGDSLVKKIFTEGIGQAEAVLVVLSRHSITKRWVAAELDAAVVKRIQDDAKLIPIRAG